ncbi:MAG: hypothetical protein FJ354_02525 [Thaumarchaeota archaeon]|nr:hypothetical protein [Nitrososphaerota archaeon]
MIRLNKKKQDISIETQVNTVWVSTFLALALTIPALAVFLGIYFGTGNLAIGAIVGFGLHFFTLAFSDRISKKLTGILS